MGTNIGVFGSVSKKIKETVTVDSNKKIQFRDTGIYLQSSADGKLLISSDGAGADDIILDGNVTCNNDLTISGSFSYGAVTATSFVNTGTTQLGNATADTVTIYGHVATSGNPNLDWSGSSGTFKTGSGNVTVGGAATFSSTADFNGNLTASSGNPNFDWSGSSGTFKSGTGAVTLNGDVTVAAGKDVVLSGAGYVQSVNAQLTNVKANDGTAAISIADSTGNVTIAGDLTVSGTFNIDDATVSGDFDIAGQDLQATTGTLNISKSGSMTTVKGTLNVDEAVTLDTTLAVDGAATFNGNVQLGNAKADTVTLKADVEGDGTTNADFDLSASGGIFKTPTGNVTIGNGAVTVSGAAVFSSTADLRGNVTASAGNPNINFGGSSGTFGSTTGANTLNGDVTVATTKNLVLGTGSAIGGSLIVYQDGAGNKSFEVVPATSLTLGENVLVSGSHTFGTGTGAVSLNGDVTVAANKDVVISGTGYLQTVSAQITNIKANDGTASIVLSDTTGNIALQGATTFTTGTGLTTISGDLSVSGHFNAQEFLANAFQYPAPGTDWTPAITGAVLANNMAAKKVWIPLNFLKIGDEIVSYKLVGDVHEEGGDTVTVDCKLVRVNKADPLTTSDVSGGGITQVTADGNFDSEATLGAAEVVATDKQYLLEIQATTSNVSGNEFVKVIGAEVKVNRK